MDFLIGLLTFILVLTCAVLILLVLMQLPKKDAGAGLAFGGGATDALFGAGSGNVLTKATTYAVTIFFVLAVLIGALQNKASRSSETELERAVASQPATPAGAIPTVEQQPSTTPDATNFTLETTVPAETSPEASTNAPATE